MAQKVLIVGCGLTGAAISYILKRQAPAFTIEVWEKARGAGGRMTTNRVRHMTPSPFADLGAQYITKGANSPRIPVNESIYETLQNDNILASIDLKKNIISGMKDYHLDMEHFIVSGGTSNLVKYFSKEADKVTFQKQVTAISKSTQNNSSTPKWLVSSSDGGKEEFDAVIITAPVPQFLQWTGGDFPTLLKKSPSYQSLESVVYSSRYALACYYPTSVWSSINKIPWSTKYVQDNEIIRYISIETKKHQVEDKEVGPTLLVHTSVPWGIENLDTNRDEVAQSIIAQLNVALPDSELPPPSETKLIKWLYSQVSKPYKQAPDDDSAVGAIAITEGEDSTCSSLPPMILAGDSFTASGFDGCMYSSFKASELLQKLLVTPSSSSL